MSLPTPEEFHRDWESIMPLTDFSGEKGSGYQVGIGERGLVVHSECCADDMGPDTALKTYEALGVWLRAKGLIP